MAIYTPKGLKVRLSVGYAFALIARLSPDVDACVVLKTTEGIEFVPSVTSLVTGLICFALKVEPLYIGVCVLAAHLLACLSNIKGAYVVPGLVELSTWYSYITGYGVFLAGAAAVGYWLVGWPGVAAFFAGKLVGWGTGQFMEIQEVKRLHRKSGLVITASERHFLNAYRIHASKLGRTTNVNVSKEELQRESWGPAFDDFAVKWPRAAARSGNKGDA